MQYSFEFVLLLHFHKQLFQRNSKIVLNTFKFNTNSIGLTKELSLYFLYLSTLNVFMQTCETCFYANIHPDSLDKKVINSAISVRHLQFSCKN